MSSQGAGNLSGLYVQWKMKTPTLCEYRLLSSAWLAFIVEQTAHITSDWEHICVDAQASSHHRYPSRCTGTLPRECRSPRCGICAAEMARLAQTCNAGYRPRFRKSAASTATWTPNSYGVPWTRHSAYAKTRLRFTVSADACHCSDIAPHNTVDHHDEASPSLEAHKPVTNTETCAFVE